MPKPPRPTFNHLVCHELGYCCEFAFFSLFKRTGMIAERLGLEKRTVRYHKAAFVAGETICEDQPKCLLNRHPKIKER